MTNEPEPLERAPLMLTVLANCTPFLNATARAAVGSKAARASTTKTYRRFIRHMIPGSKVFPTRYTSKRMQKNARLLVGLPVVLVCAVGGYFLWQNTTRAPSSQPIPSELPGKGIVGNVTSDIDQFDITIEYTKDGFVPRDVSIAQGTRVRFLNTSDEETWPASGIHPTHSLYPEKESTDCLGSSFDSCAALKNGEFFDFTFYYTGEWRYHDHIHAYQTGSITVTQAP